MQPGLTSPEAGPACLLPMWHLFYPVVTHANTAPEDSAADTMNFLWYLTNSHTGSFIPLSLAGIAANRYLGTRYMLRV